MPKQATEVMDRDLPNAPAFVSLGMVLATPIAVFVCALDFLIGASITILLGIAAIGAGVDSLSRERKRHREIAMVGAVLGGVILVLSGLVLAGVIWIGPQLGA